MVVTRSQTRANKKRTDMGFRTLTPYISCKARHSAAGKLIDATYYKAFNRGMLAYGGFKYKVGETYTQQPRPILCQIGFHACKNSLSCLKYYTSPNILCEVQILGAAVSAGGKIATNEIKIVRRIPAAERNALLTGTITQRDYIGVCTNTYRNGKLHSLDAPAYTCINYGTPVSYIWYRSGIIHRGSNAPACCSYDKLEWYRHGTRYYPSMEIQDKYYTINADGERVIDMDAVLSGCK